MGVDRLAQTWQNVFPLLQLNLHGLEETGRGWLSCIPLALLLPSSCPVLVQPNSLTFAVGDTFQPRPVGFPKPLGVVDHSRTFI